MEWYRWLVIAVVGLFVGFQLLSILIGKKMTIGDSAVFYLSTRLKKLGVRQFVSDAVVTEVALTVARGWSEQAKYAGNDDNWAKLEMIPELINQAKHIRDWLRGDDGFRPLGSWLIEVLEKHNIPLGRRE